MKHLLPYDTETSGLPLFDLPSDHPGQPHIVQLAALVVDPSTRAEVAVMNRIVRPDGWVIPDEVAKIHGITQERAMDEGIPEVEAVEEFLAMWKPEGEDVLERIAHNESFDARILRIAIKRYIDPRNPALTLPVSDYWKQGKAHCTARLSTPILKLPPTAKMLAARRHHHKTANLGEAFKHFMGKDLEGAHDAIVDVRACADVWFAIQALNDQPIPA
jgi:DNA polymerase-3 subunit epsilon